jgi:peptidyl-prolyl cis-trans isomerase C
VNVRAIDSEVFAMPRTFHWMCWVCLAVGLSACGASHKGGKNSQVAAVVNDKEITVTQLNRVLQTTGLQEVTPELTRKALESLTDEELLVQAALKQKIDRDPAFVQSLEQARRRLLAQIFAERSVYPKSIISADEVAEYYRSEPLLFSDRKKFLVTTFLADRTDITAGVDAELEHVTSVDDVRGILDRHAIKYVTQMASVVPEQVPLNQLPRFTKAAVGDLFINEQNGGKVMLMSVTGIEKDVPLTLERARPMIEGYLRNSRNKEATQAYLRQAKATAQISYLVDQDRTAATTAGAPADTRTETQKTLQSSESTHTEHSSAVTGSAVAPIDLRKLRADRVN